MTFSRNLRLTASLLPEIWWRFHVISMVFELNDTASFSPVIWWRFHVISMVFELDVTASFSPVIRWRFHVISMVFELDSTASFSPVIWWRFHLISKVFAGRKLAEHGRDHDFVEPKPSQNQLISCNFIFHMLVVVVWTQWRREKEGQASLNFEEILDHLQKHFFFSDRLWYYSLNKN